MSDRKRDEVKNGLTRKGFEKSNNDHTKCIYYTFSGKKTSVWTKISHGSSHKKLSENIQRQIAKQCKLTNIQFDNLLDCPLTREDYETMLINNGHIRIS